MVQPHYHRCVCSGPGGITAAAIAASVPECICPLIDVTSPGDGPGNRSYVQGLDPDCPACRPVPRDKDVTEENAA